MNDLSLNPSSWVLYYTLTVRITPHCLRTERKSKLITCVPCIEYTEHKWLTLETLYLFLTHKLTEYNVFLMNTLYTDTRYSLCIHNV